MRLLNDWISESLLKAMGWTLVHSIWQLVLIAGVLWLVLKIAHKSSPALKYGFGVGALVLSLMISVGTFIFEYKPAGSAVSQFSAQNLQAILYNPAPMGVEPTSKSSVDMAASWIEQNIPLLVNFWFLGALLFLFRLVNSISEIRNLHQSSSLVTDFHLQRSLYRMAGKMGIKSAIQFRISASGVSPLTFGAFKPIILFPAGLLFQLSPAQLEAIIAHELAHVKRNDYLANLLLSGLEVIFFFHPCYWWMNNTVKELRENAADDLVLKVGIEPRNLATSLAEVINFARQNPPELALAAGKQRNPTLQRIKRILGYPSQNYPQSPIISIPMLLTLFLSVGLMAIAQQDAPKQASFASPKAPIAAIEPTFPAPAAQDTIRKASDQNSPTPSFTLGIEKNRMVFTDAEGKSYQIIGDLLISGGDTVVLSPKAKASLEGFKAFNAENMPHLDLPMAPVFPVDMAMALIPAIDFGANMPVMATFPSIPPLDMAELPMPAMDVVMPAMPALDADYGFPFAPHVFGNDTTKMSKEEKEKWAKEMSEHAKEWAKKAEIAAKEWEIKSEEWAAKFEKEFQPKFKEFESKMNEWEAANGPRMKEFEQKMAEWQAAHGPKMKEFEAKMKEWHEANKPKMKEFELKMQEWQAAQEPKMKEFELKMKEWEAAQKPKLEEFQKRMEVWQKEHQAKLEEFQKLIQQELKKDDNK